MVRSPCCEKVGLKRGRWTAEEDEKLRKYIEENGEGCWRSLPKNAGLLRCGKSCRLRWINYLRSDLKRGNISTTEEEIIINLHASMGNRWSVIAAYLPGRTDNEIKNYWNSHLSRKFHGFRRPNPDFIPPPPPPKPDKHGAGRKKSKITDRVNSSKPPVQREDPAREANAAFFMPATPTPERESLSSSAQRQENNGGGIVPDSSPTEEIERLGVDGMSDLDDIVEDLSLIWGSGLEGMEISRADEFGPGNGNIETGSGLENLMSSDSWKWEPEIHDNTFSWNWGADDGEMGVEKHDAILSWLLS